MVFWIPYILYRHCHANPSFKQVAELSEGFEGEFQFATYNRTRSLEVHRRFLKFRNKNKALITSNVHAKHFPNFMKDVDVAGKLGLTDSVLATHQYLWFGASHGAIHHDFQDNVLVQITGVVEGIVVPPNCSHFLLESSYMQ